MFSWFNQQKRIVDLEKTVKRLEEEWAALDTEWTDWYEKFRLLHMRLAKRVKDAEAKDSREGDTQAGVGGNGGSAPLVLTPTQKRIQEQILAHRRANGGM